MRIWACDGYYQLSEMMHLIVCYCGRVGEVGGLGWGPVCMENTLSINFLFVRRFPAGCVCTDVLQWLQGVLISQLHLGVCQSKSLLLLSSPQKLESIGLLTFDITRRIV